MTHSQPRPDRPAPRDPEARRHDHDQIDRLTDAVLPDLIERLTASGLGEIEIREDDWRIRLRRPAPGRTRASDRAERHERPDRRASDRAERGTERTGRAAGGPAVSTGPDQHPGRDSEHLRPAADSHGNGAGPVADAGAPHRVIATSPAVGVYQPRAEVRPGSRVRAGDRIAVVDLLGLPQDVVAPEDGVIIDALVEPGDGVEYGQDLIVIEPIRGRHGLDAPAAPPAPLSES